MIFVSEAICALIGVPAVPERAVLVHERGTRCVDVGKPLFGDSQVGRAAAEDRIASVWCARTPQGANSRKRARPRGRTKLRGACGDGGRPWLPPPRPRRALLTIFTHIIAPPRGRSRQPMVILSACLMHAWGPKEDGMGKWAARIVCLVLAVALSVPAASSALAQEAGASAPGEAPAAAGAEGGPAAGTGETSGAAAATTVKGDLCAWRFPRPKA